MLRPSFPHPRATAQQPGGRAERRKGNSKGKGKVKTASLRLCAPIFCQRAEGQKGGMVIARERRSKTASLRLCAPIFCRRVERQKGGKGKAMGKENSKLRLCVFARLLFCRRAERQKGGRAESKQQRERRLSQFGTTRYLPIRNDSFTPLEW